MLELMCRIKDPCYDARRREAEEEGDCARAVVIQERQKRTLVTRPGLCPALSCIPSDFVLPHLYEVTIV